MRSGAEQCGVVRGVALVGTRATTTTIIATTRRLEGFVARAVVW